MKPLPFARLVRWLLSSLSEGSCFGMERGLIPHSPLPFCGNLLEGSIGLGAGPHTQLAQGIALGYYAGARVFELKTVQNLAGDQMPRIRPGIYPGSTCTHCEWSTELSIDEAFCEYVKAWFLIHIMAEEWELGSPGGFCFCASVGYDLSSLRSQRISDFLQNLKDASSSPIFHYCRDWLEAHAGLFSRITKDYIRSISPHIAHTVIFSVLSGCSPAEIEASALFLLERQGLHTLIKCPPTMLAKERVRSILDRLGLEALRIPDRIFQDSLRLYDALPIFLRLHNRAQRRGLVFGVKTADSLRAAGWSREFLQEELSLSGGILYPLALELAAQIAWHTDAAFPISFSGGCTEKNAPALLKAGLAPLSAVSTLFEPGGMGNLSAIARCAHRTSLPAEAGSVRLPRIQSLYPLAAEACLHGRTGRESLPLPPKLRSDALPLSACGIPPCRLATAQPQEKPRPLCAEICPHRAIVPVPTGGGMQAVLIDRLCNNCGACASCCPLKLSPSEFLFTLFDSTKAMQSRANDGIAVLSASGSCKLRSGGVMYYYKRNRPSPLAKDITELADTIISRLSFFIPLFETDSKQPPE